MSKRKSPPSNNAPDIAQFLTSSEHDNKHALTVYLEAIETDAFPNPVMPLNAFCELRCNLMKYADEPGKVIPAFEVYVLEWTDAQKLFIAQKLQHYFNYTVFTDDEKFLTAVSDPLKAYIKRLERLTTTKTADVRQTLKNIFKAEMERLPDTLQRMDDKDRLNFLCKIMPYVLPKIEAVKPTSGEKGENDFSGLL